jgi:hypothetical protein
MRERRASESVMEGTFGGLRIQFIPEEGACGRYFLFQSPKFVKPKYCNLLFELIHPGQRRDF